MQLTDAEWELIEPYLPIGRYGPYPEQLRQQFEGVIWRFRTGGQWREMPQEFGPWPTVHKSSRHFGHGSEKDRDVTWVKLRP
jgi:transposase